MQDAREDIYTLDDGQPVSARRRWRRGPGDRLDTTRVLRGLLFETEPLDPVSLGIAALVLVGAAVVATWLPARRVMRVDPIEILRAQ